MKKCPYCAEKIQNKAVVCKHCGRYLKPNVDVTAKPRTRVQTCLTIVIFLFLVVCVVVAITQIRDPEYQASRTATKAAEPTKAPTNTPAPTATRDPNVFYQDDVGTFTYLAEEAVKAALKSPSTAEFPGTFLELDEWGFAKHGDLVTVQSWVDAQNSFGAVVRSEFTVQFSYSTEALLFLYIDGEVMYGSYQEP